MEGCIVLKAQRPNRADFAGWLVLGIASGLFASWSIYGVLWQWPLYAMIAAFVGGGYFQRRYALRQKRKSTGGSTAPS